MTLVLASSSPRRLELLRQLGIEPVVRPADLDESILPGEDPEAYVVRVAAAKCAAVLGSTAATDVVLAADTAVVDDVDRSTAAEPILGKPVDRADARAMLRRLSGRTHRVLTGIAVASGDDRTRIETGIENTIVRFASLDDDTIEWYLDTGEPFDKAGAYGMQGAGSLLVDRIEGTADNVVGLPRRLVFDILGRLDVPFSDLAEVEHPPGG